MASGTHKESNTDEGSTARDSAVAGSFDVISPKPVSAYVGHAGTEVPTLPDTLYTAFQRPKLDPTAEGSKMLEMALRLEGRLGYFWKREQRDVAPTYFNITPLTFRAAVQHTLYHALNRLIRLKGHIQNQFIVQRANPVAHALADGVMIAAYLKLRVICGVDSQRMLRFSRKPKVLAPLELPKPFALAISQLGVVEVSSLPTRKICVPSANTDDCTSFFLPAERTWSDAAYSEAVEFAKSVGMEFVSPDLHVKMGSSWWLHTSTAEETFSSIDCCLPEDNFTESTAVLYSMFTHGTGVTFGTSLFDLTALGTTIYARVITNPHDGIAISSYFAIVDVSNA